MSFQVILESDVPNVLIEQILEDAVFDACINEGQEAVSVFETYIEILEADESQIDVKKVLAFESDLSESLAPYLENVSTIYETFLFEGIFKNTRIAMSMGADNPDYTNRVREKSEQQQVADNQLPGPGKSNTLGPVAKKRADEKAATSWKNYQDDAKKSSTFMGRMRMRGSNVWNAVKRGVGRAKTIASNPILAAKAGIHKALSGMATMAQNSSDRGAKRAAAKNKTPGFISNKLGSLATMLKSKTRENASLSNARDSLNKKLSMYKKPV